MRPLEVATLGRVVQQVGFPVVVSLTLLWSMLVQQPGQVGAIIGHLDAMERRQVAREDNDERRQVVRDEQERQRTEAIVHLVGRLEAFLQSAGHGAGK